LKAERRQKRRQQNAADEVGVLASHKYCVNKILNTVIYIITVYE